MLERLFKLSQNGTNVRTEILAGFTTFITLAYIIVVNPLILADAGIPHEAAIAATIYAAALATLLMGLWANYPIAVAPGMGLNAFFTYTVVLGAGLSWQTALGAVFISGVFFLIITVTGLRQLIVRSVPNALRSSIGVGIGVFIAFIGLKNAGIVVASEATLVTLGNLQDPKVLIALISVAVAGILMARGTKGALLISVGLASILGMIFVPDAPVPKGISDVFSTNLPDITPTLGALDIAGALKYGIFSIIFSFTIVELFDNIGTLIGVTRKAGIMDEKGNIPNLDKALTTDAIGTMGSAVLGTCTVTSYIESGAGVAEGGRTGLTAVTVAFFFLVALFFTPLVTIIQGFATAPALIIVGALMMSEIAHVKFDDFTEALPAFLTIIMMPLTFSIAQGIAFGFMSYVIVKVLSGRHHDVSWVMWFIALAFIANFALGGAH